MDFLPSGVDLYNEKPFVDGKRLLCCQLMRGSDAYAIDVHITIRASKVDGIPMGL